MVAYRARHDERTQDDGDGPSGRIMRAVGELFIVRGYTVHIEDVRDTNLTRADARKGPFDQVGVVPPRR
ncbi:hypothetical protein [Streptomyces sp. enrichment culture]|uniref:hypothetical protein n=1 Tax=Streptomyces sp. enrichment culture TaxID=1795815 RepID=UPI003F56E2C5